MYPEILQKCTMVSNDKPLADYNLVFTTTTDNLKKTRFCDYEVIFALRLSTDH
jgi:hypothetical protein